MEMTKSNSAREKHSYIPFYMDDWQGGTAGMARPVKSVYFDICLYNWDKAKPMTPAHLSLITGDLGPDMSQGIIDMLVEVGKVIHDPDRGYYSPRALAIGQQAFEVWSAKSAGGKKAGRGRNAKDTGGTPANTPKGKLRDSLKSDASMLEVSDHNQNQNQNQNHIAAAAAIGSSEQIPNDVEEDADALARIEEAARKSEELKLGVQQIVETWNAMAVTVGLSQIGRMNETRSEDARSLVAQFGADAISDAIRKIPDSKFLMGGGERGWKIKFDWMLNHNNFAAMADGDYHDGNQPAEEAKAPAAPKPPIDMQDDEANPRQAKVFREALERFVGKATYAQSFEQGIAVRLVDDTLIDVYFRSPAELAVAQASYEGALVGAGNTLKRSVRLKTIGEAPKTDDNTKHIDTVQNEAQEGVTEGTNTGD